MTVNPRKNPNAKIVFLAALASAAFVSQVPNCRADTPLDPQSVLEFPISKEGLTRISIANDGIDDLYVYPREYADNISHHRSGHAFVVAEGLDGPLYVTLVTKRGAAQDLKLIPRAKKAEPILLVGEEVSPATQRTASSPQEVYAHILGQFVGGIIPAGFTPTSSEDALREEALCKEMLRGKEPTEAIFEQAYQKGALKVLRFSVTNQDTKQTVLDNRVFWKEGDLASLIGQPTLEPQQTTKLYVIRHD